MGQRDAPGMKGLARDPGVGFSIDLVAQDRPTGGGQVHADLMCTSGDQLTLDNRVALTARHNLIARFAACAVRCHDHASTIARVSCERQHDSSLSRLR